MDDELPAVVGDDESPALSHRSDELPADVGDELPQCSWDPEMATSQKETHLSKI